MNEELTLEGLQDALQKIHKYSRCRIGYTSACGCGMMHEFFYQCQFHHKQLLEMSSLVWSEANNNSSTFSEIYGVKLVH